ncbi:tRNA(Ile)-lysidine synthase TilS/MesJ [Keratinibaculum paraultunense]|uniref:tRNA(Ile)-lysidine synthase TilS/MesJ n=1 Tax=Keratinibaculum paraultunense TaxID=1278232 RepID=A0A4R3L178_9FIRM|nr:tRNA 2-thiocytidine biosynthesis TtcA family protein [Keratinibaculum paraultunense]QQY80250.1 tRNA 2-thiocytidine biosynthesis protein TtcA [Keratinibaculum paraultunense]TCS90763.1 tRNA(Ile)-lysidine synthase TilS/MesJ [Keratinibaculum paraultunense]
MKKWYNKLFLNNIRKAVDKYNLIENEDNILVGLSGGKDSIFLIYALDLLRKNSYLDFNITGIHIDIGINANMEKVKNYLNYINIPYIYENINIKGNIFKERNPCYICSKIKRGIIARVSKEKGFNKIAYGHHMTDVVNTFLLNIIYTGQFHTFKPNSYNKEHNLYLIRPLIYVKEEIIKKVVIDENLPLGINNYCPYAEKNKRKEIAILIKNIKKNYPDFEEKTLKAIEKSNLW